MYHPRCDRHIIILRRLPLLMKLVAIAIQHIIIFVLVHPRKPKFTRGYRQSIPEFGQCQGTWRHTSTNCVVARCTPASQKGRKGGITNAQVHCDQLHRSYYILVQVHAKETILNHNLRRSYVEK